MAHPPTSPLVAVAWLRSLPDLTAGVATARPSDVSSWAQHGFIVVSVVGSAGEVDLSEQRRPILSLDSWGVSPGSSRPPKNQTAGALEIVRRAVEAFTPRAVDPGNGYSQAVMQDAWLVTHESREVPDPDASFAHYVQEIGLAWVSLS